MKTYRVLSEGDFEEVQAERYSLDSNNNLVLLDALGDVVAVFKGWSSFIVEKAD